MPLIQDRTRPGILRPDNPSRETDGRDSLRVMHVVSSLAVGGMEQFVVRLAQRQSAEGCPVTIVGLKGGPLAEQAREMGLATLELSGGRLSRYAGMMREILRFRPQIVNAHNPAALPYALLARLLCRSAVVMTRHGQEQINPLPGRRLLGWTDSVIAVSEAAARAMRRQRPDSAHKVQMIRNGVETSKPRRNRAEVRKSLDLAPQELVGAIVARIDDLKGHDTLVRALARLESSPRVTVLIVGDGPERANVEKLAAEFNLGNSVRFLGFRSDIPDLLAASDFFVLPSLTEGTPLSVLEAMAQAIPVVASNVGGIPELIESGVHGVLVPPADPESLASAITRMANPELREAMGQAGLRRALGEFSFEEMESRYYTLYRSIRGRGR